MKFLINVTIFLTSATIFLRTCRNNELDKLKYLEKKHREKTGSDKNFIQGNVIDQVK